MLARRVSARAVCYRIRATCLGPTSPPILPRLRVFSSSSSLSSAPHGFPNEKSKANVTEQEPSSSNTRLENPGESSSDELEMKRNQLEKELSLLLEEKEALEVELANVKQALKNSQPSSSAANVEKTDSKDEQPVPSNPKSKMNDWSATQYLKFGNERTRPVHDLISQIIPFLQKPNPRIYDLGCGPGNSTSALLSAFPTSTLTGVDSSPAMLRTATAALPQLTFEQGDLATYTPSPAADLLFSNAVFHWLRHTTRIPTLTRLFSPLSPGSVLAFQVPDNYTEPSHALMRRTAQTQNASWSPYFSSVAIADLRDLDRPDLDPVEDAEAFYNALIPFASRVEVWRTEYQHVLGGVRDIVEWVRGTGLQPYLNRITHQGARDEFLEAYEEGLRGEYGALVDGRVMLRYPRLFVVAVRK